MDNRRVASTVIFIGIFTATMAAPIPFVDIIQPPQDFVQVSRKDFVASKTGSRTEFKYLWLAKNGTLFPDQAAGRLEIAATVAVTDEEHRVGAFIVTQMSKNMPIKVFNQLANRSSVGLFTAADKTTCFPEFVHLADRPECAGNCTGACSNTCTGDGRKYDSVAGLAGIRATCLDDNFMCSAADPYSKTYSVLVHEFGHIIHQLGLWGGVSNYYDKVSVAYENARANATWVLNSYAMSNIYEYFAEGTSVFFNTNNHPDSSGGMNRCGRPRGFCANDSEARDWLKRKDPKLFDVLSFTFTNYQPTLPGGLVICAANVTRQMPS